MVGLLNPARRRLRQRSLASPARRRSAGSSSRPRVRAKKRSEQLRHVAPPTSDAPNDRARFSVILWGGGPAKRGRGQQDPSKKGGIGRAKVHATGQPGSPSPRLGRARHVGESCSPIWCRVSMEALRGALERSAGFSESPERFFERARKMRRRRLQHPQVRFSGFLRCG